MSIVLLMIAVLVNVLMNNREGKNMRFDYDKVNKCCQDLQTITQALQESFNYVRMQGQNVSMNWKGPAAESYISKLNNNVIKNFDVVIAILNQNINNLAQASANYQAHEQSAVNVFDKAFSNLE